jgi:hypothetical protein
MLDHVQTGTSRQCCEVDFKIAGARSLAELLQIVQNDLPEGVQPADSRKHITAETLTRLILTATVGDFEISMNSGITQYHDCLGINEKVIELQSDEFYPTRTKLDWKLLDLGRILANDKATSTIWVDQLDLHDLGQLLTRAQWEAPAPEWQRFNAVEVQSETPDAAVRKLLEEGERQGVPGVSRWL